MAYFQNTEKKNTEVNVRKGQGRIPIDAENKIHMSCMKETEQKFNQVKGQYFKHNNAKYVKWLSL